MSVRIMNLVYSTTFGDMEYPHIVNKKDGSQQEKIVRVAAACAKTVCLAMADCANDEGESIYPSIETLSNKTEYTRPSVISAMHALKHAGIIIPVSKKRDCINYTIDLGVLISMPKWRSEYGQKIAAKTTGRPASDFGHMDDETHAHDRKSVPAVSGGQAEKPKKQSDPALAHPAVMAYRDVTHRQLSFAARQVVAAAIDAGDAARWGDCVRWWIGQGWNPGNVNGMLGCYRSGEFETPRPRSGFRAIAKPASSAPERVAYEGEELEEMRRRMAARKQKMMEAQNANAQ